MFGDRSSQNLGIGCADQFISTVQMGLASYTSDHQGFHIHEPRPLTPDDINQSSKIRSSSRRNVLIENKKWLDCLNFSSRVSNGEIQIVEFGMDSVVYNFV